MADAPSGPISAAASVGGALSSVGDTAANALTTSNLPFPVLAAIGHAAEALTILSKLANFMSCHQENEQMFVEIRRRLERIHRSLKTYALIPDTTSETSRIPKSVLERVCFDLQCFKKNIKDLSSGGSVFSVKWVIYALDPKTTYTHLKSLKASLRELENHLDTYGLLGDFKATFASQAEVLLRTLDRFQLNVEGKFEKIQALLNLLVTLPSVQGELGSNQYLPASREDPDDTDYDALENETVQRISEMDKDGRELFEKLAESGSSKEVKAAIEYTAHLLWSGWRINDNDVFYERNPRGLPSKLGQGQSSTVFKAHLQLRRSDGSVDGPPRPVALKELRLPASTLNRHKADVLREVYLQMNITHPCVLRTYGMFWPESFPASHNKSNTDHYKQEQNHEHNKRKQPQEQDFYNQPPYIILERMTMNLSDGIRLPVLDDEHEQIRIGLDVARALEHLHERGVVHRDVKPANVLLRVVEGKIIGFAKLCDFGVSRRIYLRNNKLSVGGESTTFAGTVQYTPPEVLSDMEHCRSRPSWDTWSFGMLICFLAAKGPRPALESINVLNAKRFAESGELLEMVHAWKESIRNKTLRDIASSCLRKNRQERPFMSGVTRRLAKLRARLQKDESREAPDNSEDRLQSFHVFTTRESVRDSKECSAQDPLYIKGKHFEYGEQRSWSMQRAFQAFKDASAKGDCSLRSTRSLAALMLEGTLTNADEQLAFQLLADASGKADLPSMAYIADCYEKGRGVVKNITRAQEFGQCFMKLSEEFLKDGEEQRSKTKDENGTPRSLIAQLEKDEILFRRAECFRRALGTDIDVKKAVSIYAHLVTRKHIRAQVRLGSCLLFGNGIGKDEKTGARCLERAAVMGNTEAMRLFALCFRNGTGVQRNEEKAVKLLAKAVMWGDKTAASQLDQYFEMHRQSHRGQLVEKWLDSRLEQGSPPELELSPSETAFSGTALLFLGRCYEQDEFDDPHLRKAVCAYALAASFGVARAFAQLGACFQYGVGVPVDACRAVAAYEVAKQRGDFAAMKCLASYWMFSVGARRDQENALKVYTSMVVLGERQARLVTGLCYEYGIGVAVDYASATKAYGNGAEAPKRQRARLLMLGRGVDRDEKRAAHLFWQAGNDGDVAALRCLGACFEMGRGVRKDLKEAARLYLQAARKDDVKAIRRLYYFYRDGRGVLKNDKLALEMLLIRRTLITLRVSRASKVVRQRIRDRFEAGEVSETEAVTLRRKEVELSQRVVAGLMKL